MTTFEVGAWDEAGVRVVEVSGAFDLSACPQFRQAAARDDAELVVIDLTRVTFLDSCALRELIDLQRIVGLRRSKLAILRPATSADRIFKLTGIDGHLPLYDDKVPPLAQFNFG